MTRAILIRLVVICFCFNTASAFEHLTQTQVDKIADAIFKVENSTKYPYGIKSIKLKGNTQIERETYARKACQQTIVNNYIRWQKAGKTNDFISFLGNRFCPTSGNLSPAERKLNKNWIGNLKKELK